MKTADALDLVYKSIKPDNLVIFSDGRISTETLFLNDAANHFYMLGSMGQASMIGLGVAIGQPDRKCIVVEGDGNLLMNPASMIVIGQEKPNNFYHIVIDNGVYGTTGSQKTITWNMNRIAEQCGYNQVIDYNIKKNVQSLSSILKETGPIFIRIKVNPGSLPDVPSFSKDPKNIVEDFTKSIKDGQTI